MSAGIQLRWVVDGSTGVAHLCAINADGPNVRAAAICGTVSGANVWQKANPESRRCPKCVNIDESGDEIVFVMPNNGRRVTVRERRR